MHKFTVTCTKPKHELLGEGKSIADAKNLVIDHYEKETGETLSGVDRIVCTTSLMVAHSVDLGKYHYILENQ